MNIQIRRGHREALQQRREEMMPEERQSEGEGEGVCPCRPTNAFFMSVSRSSVIESQKKSCFAKRARL